MPEEKPSAPAADRATIAVVVKGYPRLSETFIAQELRGLEQLGFRLYLFSLRHPADTARHPVHDEIAAPVTYLPEYLHQEPMRVLRAWRRARRLPGYRGARRLFMRDLRRDFTRNRVRRFGQALVLATSLPRDTSTIYAHFIHTPASVARYAAALTGLPFAVSAHAKDIWTSPDWDLAAKLGDARFTVTCTEAGRNRLAGLAADPAKVHLLHHGLDLERFEPPANGPRANGPQGPDGTDPARPVVLVSVGRLVPKKGYDVLLGALADLPDDLAWRLVHIGGGPERQALRDAAARLGIAERIDWRGAQPQGAVLDALRMADLFVLASRIDDSGDRDGLPNVLMEAQSQRVCCVSTALSGIPELIADGETGVLVPPDDAAALTEALAALIGDPARRLALGNAGFERLHAAFDHRIGVERLARLIGGQTDKPVEKPGAAGLAPLRPPSGEALRIAFYAPLKPPGHATPSGDRRIARLLMRALTLAGHEVSVASELRAYEGAGDGDAQRAIRDMAAAEAGRLIEACRSGTVRRPDAWVTYHLYHKAPDWIGPRVAAALGIPYIVAEAAYSPKQAGGPWAAGLRQVETALAEAAGAIHLNPRDAECVDARLPPGATTLDLAPFLETAPYAAARRQRPQLRRQWSEKLDLPDDRLWLLAVGMMRPGDKAASYSVLAESLKCLREGGFAMRPVLLVAGDGDAADDIRALFGALSEAVDVRFLGAVAEGDLPGLYAVADLMVWPAVNEAIGMAILEAQAAGTPVVAGAAGAIPRIVSDGETGALAEEGDAAAFAAAIGRAIDGGLLARTQAAAEKAARVHDIGVAARRLDAFLRAVTAARAGGPEAEQEAVG